MGLTLSIDPHILLGITFFLLLFFFSVYGLFLGYHWFTFGTHKRTSTIALAVYLGGGAILFMTFGASIGLLPS